MAAPGVLCNLPDAEITPGKLAELLRNAIIGLDQVVERLHEKTGMHVDDFPAVHHGGHVWYVMLRSPMHVDLELLARQKRELIALCADQPPERSLLLEGIVNTLDWIQDSIGKIVGDDNVFFNVEGEGGETRAEPEQAG